MRRLLLVVTWAACLLAPARPAAAQAPLQVLADEARVRFAERLAFELRAHAERPITDVVLHYVVGADGVQNRRIPEFGPGRELVARQEESIARGQLPPASEITWWWTLTDDAGQEIRTEPRTVRYLDERFDWRQTGGEDVNVWWYGQPEAFATGLAERARSALAELGERIGTMPEVPVQIVTYQSRDDMRAALPDRGEVFEERLSTLGSRVAPDILLLLAGDDNPELDDVMRHELSHIVLHLHLGEEYLSAPAWLDEGLAMAVEGELAADEARLLSRATREDALMSLRSLSSFPGQAELVPLAYAESRDVVVWLIDSHGAERFQRLLDTLAEGQLDADGALTQVYGADQLGLYQAYRAARGLAPAATPAPGATRAPRRPARGGLCGGAALALPALGLALAARGRRRRRGPPPRGREA